MPTSPVGLTDDWLGFLEGIKSLLSESSLAAASISLTEIETPNHGSVIYCFLVTLEGLEEVPSQGKDSCVARHLEEQVHIMWYGHELGQCRSS